jgi:hypothetical protein
MRSRELDTKFHQMKRGPSSGAPPSSITRAGPSSARSTGALPASSTASVFSGSGNPSRVKWPCTGNSARSSCSAGRRTLAPGFEFQRHVEGVGVHLHRRVLAEGAAGDHRHLHAVDRHDRQLRLRVVGKIGRDFLVLARQRDPGLQAVEAVRHVAQPLGRALGMHDAAAGGHPVDVAGIDLLHRAERVAMHHRAVPQVGDGGQADVRVRAHRHRLLGPRAGRGRCGRRRRRGRRCAGRHSAARARR